MSGFRVHVLGSMVDGYGLWSVVYGLKFEVQGLWCKVRGSGFNDEGSLPPNQLPNLSPTPQLLHHHITLLHGNFLRPAPKVQFSVSEQLLSRNVERFQGGLVFKAHRSLYHSTLRSRITKKRKEGIPAPNIQHSGDFWTGTATAPGHKWEFGYNS